MDPTKPELKVEWTVTETAVKIKYRVENQTGQPVYLVNVMTVYQKDKGRVPDKKLAYAFLLQEKEQLEFCKRIPPVPQDGRLVTPYTWFVNKLEDGNTFEEELTFKLPLKESRPYLSFVGKSAPKALNLKAETRFVLGYFPDDPRLKPEHIVENGVKVIRIVAPDEMPPPPAGTSLPIEHLLRSKPKTIPIEVTPLPDLVKP